MTDTARTDEPWLPAAWHQETLDDIMADMHVPNPNPDHE